MESRPSLRTRLNQNVTSVSFHYFPCHRKTKPVPVALIFSGAEKLRLTPDQEAGVRAWMAKQGDTINPGDLARFLETILDARQRDILREIMQQPTNA